MKKNSYAGINILLFGACWICVEPEQGNVGFGAPESDLLLRSLLQVSELSPEVAVSPHLRRG